MLNASASVPSRGALFPSYSFQRIAVFAAGAITVLGFAPFQLFPVPLITLALLFWLWANTSTPQRAFAIGWYFGLGLFLAGISWIYVSLHTFGAMPLPLAGLATLLFCAFLALFPAVGGYVVARARCSETIKLALLAPAVWTLIEWTRSWIFTGFPWLAVGYSQAPLSPLAGFVPVVGVFGITLIMTVISGLLVVQATRKPFALHYTSYFVVALFLLGLGLKQIEWTTPTGTQTSVSLLQGNVAQDMKWREDRMIATLNAYRAMTLTSKSQLIVMPETALPLFLHQVPPEYLDELAAHARANNGAVLVGVPERLRSGEYFNSVIALGGTGGATNANLQGYRKSHLVPFGEFIPLRPVLGWIVSVLAIPLQDFSRGSVDQQPLDVAGQRVAVNICYEDVFGEEIIRQLPQATILVNASNVAWFGRSIAPQQHLQISQMRALETGRYMLRATNTGVTAVIDTRGNVIKAAPEFTTATVTHAVPGYQGTTPFVRWGNYAALLIAVGMLVIAVFMPRKAQNSL
ncbi:MAG: apolipoprotein N-acyltransferase [Burkholderiales bacterium]